MPINNRGLAGQPMLPYPDFRSYMGADVTLQMTFLDQAGNAVTPTSITLQLDDITNAVNMVPSTTSVPTANPQVMTIPGASMKMTYPYEGSQLCQLTVTATLINAVTGASSQVVGVSIIELVAIQTPNS